MNNPNKLLHSLTVAVLLCIVSSACQERTSRTNKLPARETDKETVSSGTVFDTVKYDVPHKRQADLIMDFEKAVRSRRPERIAPFFEYPFVLRYPLPPIADEKDFVERFDLILDENIMKRIDNVKEWYDMPQGIMADSGDLLWGNCWGDRFKVTSLAVETTALEEAWRLEVQRQKCRVHHSVRDYERPLFILWDEGSIYRVDEVSEDVYRLVGWKDGKTMLEEPDLILRGEMSDGPYGSAACPQYDFKDGDLTYSVGFEVRSERFYGLYCNKGLESQFYIEATTYEDGSKSPYSLPYEKQSEQRNCYD